jgi:hypothetical protein
MNKVNSVVLLLLLAPASIEGIKNHHHKQLSQVNSQFWPFTSEEEVVVQNGASNDEFLNKCLQDEACKAKLTGYAEGL